MIRTNGHGQQVDFVNVNRRKLFENCLNVFVKDFEFVDVQDDCLCQRLLTEDECHHIMEEPPFQRQIERLFFLLTYDEKKSLETFISVLRPYYRWLGEELLHNIRHPKDDSPDVLNCVKRSWMPSNRNFLVHRCDLVSVTH